MKCTHTSCVVCDSVDTKVLVAKEGYAPSIAPSPFKRHGGSKILLLIKVKNKKINIRKFCRNKKNTYICSVIKKGGKYGNIKKIIRKSFSN